MGVLDACRDAFRFDALSAHLPRDVGEIGDGSNDAKRLLGMERRRGKDQTKKRRGSERQPHQNL
jgi:hypothetical protein